MITPKKATFLLVIIAIMARCAGWGIAWKLIVSTVATLDLILIGDYAIRRK